MLSQIRVEEEEKRWKIDGKAISHLEEPRRRKVKSEAEKKPKQKPVNPFFLFTKTSYSGANLIKSLGAYLRV